MKSAYDNRWAHTEVQHLGPTCSRFQPQKGKIALAEQPIRSASRNIFADAHPNLEEEIRRLAFEIYVERDREDGHDLDDWLLAEAEILGTA